MADTFERATDEYEAMVFTGSNAAAVKAWADGFDASALTVTAGALTYRPRVGGQPVPVVSGDYLFAGGSPAEVFKVEAAEVSRRWRKKASGTFTARTG
jgi:hypothetical protein